MNKHLLAKNYIEHFFANSNLLGKFYVPRVNVYSNDKIRKVKVSKLKEGDIVKDITDRLLSVKEVRGGSGRWIIMVGFIGESNLLGGGITPANLK